MQYLEFRQKLKDFTVFSLSDIKKIDPKFHRRQLNTWQDKGYIKKLRRGYYIFTDTALDEQVLFLIANKLYSPSYVSFETALSHYNLIPEGVYVVTSASSKKRMEFATPIGRFSYQQLKPQLIFGYSLEKRGKQSYKLAEIEKAVLDYLYLHPTAGKKADLYEWRFNSEEFKVGADMNKFNRYLKVYNNRSLERRAKNFIKFINQEQ
jgi:predicted transcriptional regulator of viral defense system